METEAPERFAEVGVDEVEEEDFAGLSVNFDGVRSLIGVLELSVCLGSPTGSRE